MPRNGQTGTWLKIGQDPHLEVRTTKGANAVVTSDVFACSGPSNAVVAGNVLLRIV
jgi:hypothetical protein